MSSFLMEVGLLISLRWGGAARVDQASLFPYGADVTDHRF